MDLEGSVVVIIIAAEDKNVFGDVEDTSKRSEKLSDKKIIIAGVLTTCTVTETTTVQAAASVNEEGADRKSNKAKQKKKGFAQLIPLMFNNKRIWVCM